ncbi:MAG: alpha/beta hydrolase [Verrucomicrobiales bacterium]
MSIRCLAQQHIAEATRITTPPGIDSLEKVNLGGIDQFVLFRGHDATADVLLFVHGGPGVPNMPFCHLNANLEKHFVLVQWDQRGAGKSYAASVPTKSMNIDQFISDTKELSELLITRFEKDKIFLLGHSWGSVIGAKAAARHPELYHTYIGVSQVTDVMGTQTLLYERTLAKAVAAGNKTAINELKSIGAPPFAKPDDHLIACRWLAELQDQRYIEKRQLMTALVSSPYYTLADLNRFRNGMRFSIDYLWSPLGTVNLFEEIPSFRIPVTFIQGREDPLIPGELIERYSAKVDAPKGKRLVWIENAGHMPHFEAPNDFESSVIDAAYAMTQD